MTNYYYDKDGHNEISIFFDEKKFKKILDVEDVDEALAVLRPSDIIFAHVFNRSSWIRWANKNENVDVVFMSTQACGATPPDRGDPGNVRACKYPAKNLGDHERVKKFFSILQSKGERCWELLEPEPYPEYTVAAYLLMVAKQQGVAFSQATLGHIAAGGGEKFWQAVEKELDERQVATIDLPSNWSDFLNVTDIAACQGKLRQSFPATSK